MEDLFPALEIRNEDLFTRIAHQVDGRDKQMARSIKKSTAVG
jgi:hypothetical protein